MFDDILRAWGMPSDFIECHWRRSPASGRMQGPVPGVPNAAEVRALLHQSPRADRVSISTAGRLHHPVEYTVERTIAGRTVADIVDPNQVNALLASGATAVLANCEHWLPPAMALAEDLASELSCEMQVHVFLTGPGRAGLVPHVDGEDNFLLQIDGTKSWSLWPNDSIRPAHVRPETLGPAAMTVDLHPGDSLYIPVGWTHAGVAGDEGSSHITYQVVPVQLLDAVLDQLAEELEPLLLDRLSGISSSVPLPHGAASDAARRLVKLLEL